MIGRPVLLNAWNSFWGREEHVESSFNMIKTIDTEHARIHDGLGYNVAETIVVAAGASARYLINVNGEAIHLRDFTFKATTGPGGVAVHESPFFDTNSLGTQLTPVNLNRRGTIGVSSVGLFRDPFTNVNSLGDQIDSDLMEQSTGGPVKAAGGSAGGPAVEWVLPASGSYLVSYTNSHASDAALVGTKLFWYEES